MNRTKRDKKTSRSGSSDAHGIHHCCISAPFSVYAYCSVGTRSDQLKQEEAAWFTDGLGQCEGASLKWTVVEL